MFEISKILISMHWIKEVEIAKSIDELTTWRSIVERSDFPDYDMLDAMITSASKRLLEEQRAQKHDRFLQGRQIAYMIYEHFRATGAYEAVQGLSRLQRSMGSCSIISKRNAFRCDPGRIVQVKITRPCSASDCLGFVRPRNRST